MLRTYHNAVMYTKLAGPTYFENLLRRFLEIVQEEIKIYSSLYFIFVIVTDGCLHDMEMTRSLIVQLSYYPISIIIVGIGNEDFALMEILDADEDVLMDASGRNAARDII